MLLLPQHHEFAETLANLPFFYKEIANRTCEAMHLIQKNPNYLPEMVNANELQEYLLGGEANQFVEYIDGYADVDVDVDVDESEEKDNCLNSWELSDEWLGLI
jgi:hypothetical protein